MRSDARPAPSLRNTEQFTPLPVSADELPPHEQRHRAGREQHHLFSGTDKQLWVSPVPVGFVTVVPAEDGESSFADISFVWRLLQIPGASRRPSTLRFARDYSFRDLKP